MGNVTFKLYKQFHSSLFDLIEGDFETKQTKGLGVVLAKSHIFLEGFLKLKKVRSNIELDSIDSYSKIVVNCELISDNEDKRLDVLIRFYKTNRLENAIIIEAKTISKSISYFSAKEQLKEYVKSYFKDLFENINDNNILKIVLTKYENAESSDNTISLAWNDILNALYSIKPESNNLETLLCRDYFEFLTKINGTMKFYEKEIYSIPSADWSQELIEKYHIYECLNSGRYVIKKKPLYITFRKSGGGQMERLYKIDEIIILNPMLELESFKKSDYDKEKIDSIERYCKFMTDDEKGHWKSGLPNDERQFIILSRKDNIELKEPYPKPLKNNSYRAYYTLSEILNNTIGQGENAE